LQGRLGDITVVAVANATVTPQKTTGYAGDAVITYTVGLI